MTAVSMGLSLRLCVVASAVAAFGCRAAPVSEPARAVAASELGAPSPGPAPPVAPSSSPTAGQAVAPAAPPREPVLVVAEPAVLARLETLGFDAGTMITGTRATSTGELARAPAYGAILAAIRSDLAEDRSRDPALGVGLRFSHRQFDVKWLSSPDTRFELIDVVNRLDRRPFAPEHCGEVRFVYRLTHSGNVATHLAESRLPMTVNVVSYVNADAAGSCAAAAQSWLAPEGVADRAVSADYLVSKDGPLAAARLAALEPRSVEVNFQSVRWPSTVRPSMGGHAEYVLRVFHRIAVAPFLAIAPLENVPDVPRLVREPSARERLLTWLRAPQSLSEIDRGIARIPDEFLATRAVSIAPHGLARLENRPFSSLFGADVADAVALRGTTTITTTAALLRRLDTLSCPGCHQSRSIAGFHLLGVEPGDVTTDAVEVPMSPHFHAELARRGRYVVAVAEGRRPDDARPPPERGPGDDGAGAHCGLGDPGFASWTCSAGLVCARVSDPDVGECVRAEGASIGDACEGGTVSRNPNARADSMRLRAQSSCGAGVCESNGAGFPGGMCDAACDALPSGAACGRIALLDEFNACLATGKLLADCAAAHSRPAALRACGFHAPCRDDYACARNANGGVCMPPYFLSELRVDGHVF
jgi:hypothetical protein